ncbi:MAG: carbohydrate ABC transporter permease [Defluviitaleaceae bacterium]|nr:carbohydrate ABC transporter permease [Defluviitaleaceae bacterium]
MAFAVPVAVLFLRSLEFDGVFPTLGQYYELLITNYTFLNYFWNSVAYSSVITAGCVTVSFPLGFLFAKVKFPGRNAAFFFYLLMMLLPFQSTLLPNYIQLRSLGLLDMPAALVLPTLFSPFAVFLFRQFIVAIPDSLIECASLDTSSALAIYRHVVFPQVKHAAVALSVLIFCESWNMVEQAIIFAAGNPDIRPLSVVLDSMPANVSFSAAFVYIFPALFLFFRFKDALVDSISGIGWK